MTWPCDYFPPRKPCPDGFCRYHLYSFNENLIDKVDEPTPEAREVHFCALMIDKPWTLEEVAEYAKISGERVRQIENFAFGKFITKFQKEDAKHFDPEEKERIIKLLAGKIKLHHRTPAGALREAASNGRVRQEVSFEH